MNQQKIIFVYNADSGFFSLVKDFFHKAFRPSTYPCNLCGITYSNFGMKKDWKNFISSLNVPVRFLHRDEFLEQYTVEDVTFPCAYIERGSNLDLIISQEEMDKLKNLEELKDLILKKGKELNITIQE